MEHKYEVGDLFYYYGNYEEFHGLVGEVRKIKRERGYYSCRLLTDKELPITRWRLPWYKMKPYNKTPDWEI